MKRNAFLVIVAAVSLLACGPVFGEATITMDDVNPLLGGDSISAGVTVRFTMRAIWTPDGGTTTHGVVLNPGWFINGFTSGFQVYEKNAGDGNFLQIGYDTLPYAFATVADTGWSAAFNLIFAILSYGVDGIGADTVGFGGQTISGAGFPDGFSEQVWYIETGSNQGNDTICIDSSWFPPGGPFIWIQKDPNSFNQITFITDWFGPFCYHVEGASAVEERPDAEMPTSYALEQNYPNPFNPVTNINFDVPVRSHVTLTIYNIVGQKVRTLVDKELAPKGYVVDWDGTTDTGQKAASGVYFYKLEAESFVATKKMVLLK